MHACVKGGAVGMTGTYRPRGTLATMPRGGRVGIRPIFCVMTPASSPEPGTNVAPVAVSPQRPSVMPVLTGACAFVGLAYWLGADWLSDKAWGIPVGAWLPALAAAWAKGRIDRQALPINGQISVRSGLHSIQTAADGQSLVTPTDGERPFATLLGRTAAATLSGAERLDVMLAATPLRRVSFERVASLAAERALARTSMPVRSLRIGLAVDGRWVTALVRAPRASGAEWLQLAHGEDPGEACARHGLDAVVYRGAEDRLFIATLERSGCDAAWFDWGQPRPLSYESVFPLRIDAARITLPINDETEAPIPLLVRLIESAAVLSRHPSRLTEKDRLLGRQSLGAETLSRKHRGVMNADPAADAMCRLGYAMVAGATSSLPGETERAAARAVGAWAATYSGPLQENDRRSFAEAAARILGDEPEAVLRLAAVRLGAFDDSAGIEALVRADRVLRSRAASSAALPISAADPVLFVQSELEHGGYTPLTLGRVAAGICLACASSPASRLAYLRDDLMDDMRYSGWLVGRDQDRRLLLEVFRELEAARNRESASGCGVGGGAGMAAA